jgi:hypothetical protein
MVDWTSGTNDANVAERDSGFVVVRIPGTPDVLKEAAVSGFVTKDAGGNVNVSGAGASISARVTNTAASGFTSFEFSDGSNIKGQIWAGNGSYASFGGAGSLNYSANGGPHVWHTNYTERMRITNEGQFRWGNSATIDTVSFLPFQVKGGIAIDTTTTASQSAMSFFNGQGANTRVGWIGTVGSSTSYNTSSDMTLKKNIADAQDPESIILSILIRQFDWKVNDEHQRYGAIAQELLDVYPEAVSSGPDGILGVDFSKFIPMMLKHIQLLTARVALLEGAL